MSAPRFAADAIGVWHRVRLEGGRECISPDGLVLGLCEHPPFRPARPLTEKRPPLEFFCCSCQAHEQRAVSTPPTKRGQE